MRTVFWDYDSHSTKMIDQRLLPWEFVIADFTDYQEVARAIKEMVVRGAPTIGRRRRLAWPWRRGSLLPPTG